MLLVESLTYNSYTAINRIIKLLKLKNILFMDENTILSCKPFGKNYNTVGIFYITNNFDNLNITRTFSSSEIDDLNFNKNITITSIDNNKKLLYHLQYTKKINKEIDLIEDLNQECVLLQAYGDEFLKKYKIL